jgi:hypothetical protein
MDFINHLLSFSTRINRINLNKTSVKKIIWIEEIYLDEEYLDPYCLNFQSNLINAKEKFLVLIINNFDEAIKSKCGNNINLTKYSEKDYYNYRFETDENQQNINKRYYNVKITPEDKKVFKEIWLHHYITTLSKIVANIRKVTNNPKQVAMDELDNLKKVQTNFIETLDSKGEIYNPIEVEKEFHNKIFKDNAFEVWQSMFEKFNITKSKRADIDFMFNVMVYNKLIHNTIRNVDIQNWINEVYEISFDKIKYSDPKSTANEKRLIIYNDIISK